MNKNIAIKVRNLTKIYKLYKEPIDRLKEAFDPFNNEYHTDFYALKDISFEIKRGETVGIIGRNGSGKSTLLEIITGVLTPTNGTVFIRGKISAILELGAGFNPEMSGLENIYLSTSISGMSKQDTDKKIDDILLFAELGEFIYQPIKTYSSGMKTRLGFAVAINIKPDILIIDEALAVGDVAFQRKCFAKMEQIRKTGATILFVSHSEESIVNLCNRAIWLSDGEKVIDGEPKFVTGLYMKNTNKKVIDKIIIKNELEELENQEEIKKREIQNKNKSNMKEFYDPLLRSKSTIYYEEKGAKISNVRITTLDDIEVNTLNSNNRYSIIFDVLFKKKFKDVNFGIVIKDLKGNNIFGASYEMLKHAKIKSISSSSYTINFIFDCLLVEGIFVVDLAVHDDFKTHRHVLHRINDAFIFKVIKHENTNLNQGKIALFKKCTII